MMKKTYKSSLLALSVLASFTSCSESESLQQANLSKDKITFHATLDNTWNPLSPASSSRAAIAAATEKGPIVVPTPFGKPLYLHPVVQDGIHIWSKEGKPITRSGAPLEDVEHERVAQTRGTMSTKIGDYGSFGVTAIYKEGDNNVLLLDNAEAEKTDGEFWGFTNNSNARWPIGSTVSFHAYAPHSSADKSQLTYGVDKDNVQTQITYTASTTEKGINNQPDLILATNAGSRQSADPDKAVSLSFQHALTAVTFALDKSFYDKYPYHIDSLVLKGIPNKGTCKLSLSATDDVPSVTWSMDNGTGHYSFNLFGALQTPGEDLVLTSANQTLMMIPQTLPESAEVILYMSANGRHAGIIASLKDQKWEAGKSIIYKISGSLDIDDPKLKIVYPDTWTAHSFPKTSFQENDIIGLYIIDADGKFELINGQLTYAKLYDGTYGWMVKDDPNFYFLPGNRYFAYYPYSASMPDVDRTALTASDFFKTKISSLADNVVADQSKEGTFLAQDFQMARGFIGPDAGSIVFNMEHQVGLAVLDLKSKEILETRQFKNDKYMYYYGQGTTEPVEGTDYTCVGNKLTFTPSDQFVDNKPYHVKDNKYLQVIPLGKTMQFKADNKSGTKVESWGYDQAISLSPTRNNPVVRANIECGVPFTKIERLYLSQREAVEEFDIPEVTEYTLSCWGATGTSLNNGTVSAAGFAKATWTPTASDKKLYICVGNRSGYNNGKSSGYNPNGGWGGGASHIATSLRGNGETYNYENYKNDLLMVSGGSGAASFSNASKPSGYGGGSQGGEGRANSSWDMTVKPHGGTQTGPGRNTPSSNVTLKKASAFGIGGYALKDNIGVQGGSGFYGGGGGFITHNAGGGSGYMNTARVNQQTFLGGNEVNKQDSHPDPNKLGACRITWTYHRPNTLK